jgi:phage gp36-like protein
MTYATRDDLQERFGLDELTQLTDRMGAGVPDDTLVARALADADAEIDGYLAVRYLLPVTSVPPMLARVACDIARYRLWDDRASAEVRERYTDARRLLELIAKGTVGLGLSSALPLPLPSQSAATSGSVRAFTRDGTDGY